MSTKKEDVCIKKAFDDEMLFVLMGRDASAIPTIGEWIKLNIGIQPREKLIEALDCAIKMFETGYEIRVRKDTLKKLENVRNHDPSEINFNTFFSEAVDLLDLPSGTQRVVYEKEIKRLYDKGNKFHKVVMKMLKFHPEENKTWQFVAGGPDLEVTMQNLGLVGISEFKHHGELEDFHDKDFETYTFLEYKLVTDLKTRAIELFEYTSKPEEKPEALKKAEEAHKIQHIVVYRRYDNNKEDAVNTMTVDVRNDWGGADIPNLQVLHHDGHGFFIGKILDANKVMRCAYFSNDEGGTYYKKERELAEKIFREGKFVFETNFVPVAELA